LKEHFPSFEYYGEVVKHEVSGSCSGVESRQ
jgi:hypothetical protein